MPRNKSRSIRKSRRPAVASAIDSSPFSKIVKAVQHEGKRVTSNPKYVKKRVILSPIEKSEIGVKRLREAVVAVRDAKGEKASY